MLQKTVVNIPLTGGLDTKTAPNLVTNAKMAIIQNARFVQGASGAKQKRNGYNQMPQRDSAGSQILNGSSLAVYNGQLLVFDGLGHCYTLAQAIDAWAGIGETNGAFSSTFNNFAIQETSIARGLTSYSSPSSATCKGVTVYAFLAAPVSPTAGTTLSVSVVEEATGVIYSSQSFAGTSGPPRVVTDGTLIYVLAINGAGLQCAKVTPGQPQSALAFVTVDAAAFGTMFDVVYLTAQGYFAAAYQTSASAIKLATFPASLAVFSSSVNSGVSCGGAIAAAATGTGAAVNVAVAMASPASAGSNICSVQFNLVTSGTVSAAVGPITLATISQTSIPCVTIAAPGAGAPVTVYFQVEAQPATGALRQIQSAVVSGGGSIVTPASILIRNAGIAASAFIQGGDYFLPVVFVSAVQQSYFLLKVTSGYQVVGGAFMPDNAGSFSASGVVPQLISPATGKWSLALPKFVQLEAVNGEVQYVTGIVELALDFTQTRVQGVQLGQSLVMTGPIVREFDGRVVVEQGFCNFPDTVTATVLNDYANGIITTIGTTSVGSVITVEFPSVNNGSSPINIGTGQATDGQLLIPPNWVSGGFATYFLTAWEIPSAPFGGFGYCFWYNVSGQADPTGVGGPLNGLYLGQQIQINPYDSAATIAQKTAAVMSAWATSIGLAASGGTVAVTGAAGNQVTVTAPAVATKTTLLQPAFRAQTSVYNQVIQSPGDPLNGKTPTYLKFPPGNCITPGSYFVINGFAIWFSVDGVGSAPSNTIYNTARGVAVLSTDSEIGVSFKVWQVILTLSGISSVQAILPWLIVFWTTIDNAPASAGTMLSSGLGLGDGTGVSGAYATDSYQASFIYERIDVAGQLHRSEPSIPVNVGLPSWGPASSNTFYAVSYTVPNLQLTDASGIAIIGYRTTANGQSFFRFSSVSILQFSSTAADSTSVRDNSTDAIINGNELLYTTGGVLGNDQAPPLSFLCIHQDRLWGISDEDPNLLYYTKQFAAGLEVAWSNLQTVRIDPSGGYVTSLASMDGNLIVFSQYRIWVIAGNGPSIAGTGSTFNLPQLVSTEVGCRDPFSVVLTRDGLIFKSSKGFYLLDRSSQVDPLPDLEAFNADVVTAATLIPNTTEIRFLSAAGTTQLYDTLFKQWGSFTNHQGLDACIYNGTYYYLRVPASTATPISIFQETPNQTNVVPLDNGVAFQMVLATNAIKGADIAAAAGNAGAAVQSFGRIWKNLWKGNFQGVMQVTCTYDYGTGGQVSESHLIGANNTDFWGSDPLWGGSTPWGGSGTTAAFYQFKCYNRSQLCESIQLTIQDVAPFCAWSVDALALEVGIRKGAYKRLGIGQST